MNLCEHVVFLKFIAIIKTLFHVLYIVIPLILIVLIMIDIAKAIFNDPEKIGDAINKSIKRFISAVIIFMVPTIVFAIYNLVSNNMYNWNLLCFNNATSDGIKMLEINKEASIAKLRDDEKKEADEIEKKRKQQLEKIKAKEELLRQQIVQSQSSLGIVVPSSSGGSTTPIVNGTQRALQPGDCMDWEDNCFCPDVGRLKGFQFIMKDETGRAFADVRGGGSIVSVGETCSDGSSFKVSINVVLEENFKYALKQMCLLKTTGVNGVKLNVDYINGGSLARRTNSGRTICSLHAYGAAVDINNSATYIVNGQSYKPYAGQGPGTRNAYDEFVSAIGGEANTKNINYVLWKYAFEPAGFSWGGTWNDSYFDPMHFEVK